MNPTEKIKSEIEEKQEIRCNGCSSIWEINRQFWKSKIEAELNQCPICFREDF